MECRTIVSPGLDGADHPCEACRLVAHEALVAVPSRRVRGVVKHIPSVGARWGRCPASRHAQPVNHGTSLSVPVATLATVSFHKVEHLCQVPLDGSDALLAQTYSAFLNMSVRGRAARRKLDRGTGKSRAVRIFASE